MLRPLVGLAARSFRQYPLAPLAAFSRPAPSSFTSTSIPTPTRSIRFPLPRLIHTTPPLSARYRPRVAKRIRSTRNVLLALAVLVVLYHTYSPFRHTIIASVRCARLMRAVLLDVIDYKMLFSKETAMGPLSTLTEDEKVARRAARRECHLRSAERMLLALKKNSGIYVKLGQHVAAVQVLPPEWTQTMTPLQDQCFPTPIEETDAMLRADLGMGIDDLFSEFDPVPIGVASLAQVHTAIDRKTGSRIAVKVQHADLQEFARVDMATVNFAIHLVRYIFPEFEFSWLGDEMNHMLPLEMDFRHEAANSTRCRAEFLPIRGKTSLYLPEVLWAERRCMVMEYIEGARVDNLEYLKEHSIDRNQVSQELSRIFSRMVYLNGHFHADPHHGNILLRPRAPSSTSPYNFDICLLDHGQYFDVPEDLRVNYAKFWLSLIKPSSVKTTAERKKYARLVGNIDDEMYPILETAITGRVNLADTDSRANSLLDNKRMDDSELKKLRTAVMEREGLVADIFELLRRVPRRLLMILKLSDLQRSLDHSLHTTHGQTRIFVIVARYCAEAIWLDDVATFKRRFAEHGVSLRATKTFIRAWVSHLYWATSLGTAERLMDLRARWIKITLWVHGLAKGGFEAAGKQAAGLTV